MRSLSRLRERVRVRARELRHSSTDAENAIWQRLRARQVAETDAVMENILHWLVAHHPHPNPLPQAGEGVNTTKD